MKTRDSIDRVALLAAVKKKKINVTFGEAIDSPYFPYVELHFDLNPIPGICFSEERFYPTRNSLTPSVKPEPPDKRLIRLLPMGAPSMVAMSK